MIYEVINGTHRQSKRLLKGETFESDKDMIKAFPNKFKIVEPAKEIITKDVINIAPEIVKEIPKEIKEAVKEPARQVVEKKKAKRGRKKKAK